MDKAPQLRRTLNFAQVTLYGIGTILGAGIYALIGKIVGLSGILAPVAFIVSALLALLTAYSYGELVKKFPKSAGEAEYVYQGFKSLSLSNFVGWLIVFTGVVSSASLVLGFIGYFKVFLNITDTFIIFLVLSIALGLAIKGIKESVNVVIIITLIEISGLILVCAVARESLIEKNFLISEIFEALNWRKVTPIFSGAFLAFYAFVGFEDMVNLAEETKVPGRTLSRAIMTALGVSTLLYVLVALVSISTLSPELIQKSSAPIAEMYRSYGGNTHVISLIGLFAIFNGIIAQIIMASRVLYGLRHPTQYLRWLSTVNSKTQTPINATFLVTGIILILTLVFPIETLAKATSFIILIVFTFVNLALIRCELRATPRKTKNLILPGVATLLNLGTLIFQIILLRQ
jgi:APA family basic amino acid/polyamine antiporter